MKSVWDVQNSPLLAWSEVGIQPALVSGPPCRIFQVAVRAEGMEIEYNGTAAPSPAEL